MRHPIFSLTPIVACLAAPLAGAQCPLQSFSSSDGANLDRFGSTALDGERLLAGAPGHDHLGNDAGAAYLFERVNGEWQETIELLASDGDAGDQFGLSVALSGDLAVVGAYTDSPVALFSGSAYVFERSAAGVWTETAKLVPSDGGPSHLFGIAVAIGGPDEILVGAPQAQLGAISPGAVYQFRRTAGGWSQTARLTENVPLNSMWFGSGLDVSGDRVAIGASPIGAPEYARTIVFDRSGTSWTEGQIIQLPGGAFADIDGARMLVTSPYDSTFWQWNGRARIFDLVAGTWTETALLEPETPTVFAFFGLSKALEGERILLSSKVGGSTVMQFQNGPGGWQEVSRIRGPVGHYGFGPISLSGERMLVAATEDGPGQVTEYLVGPTEKVYCDALPNSTGAAARISASACNAVSENDFTLKASPVPDQPGLFYYGTEAAQVPLGAGFRCVGGAIFRFPVSMANNGALELDVDLTAPPTPAGQITAGSTWYFQAWFRDPSDPAAFNFSDAVTVRFL